MKQHIKIIFLFLVVQMQVIANDLAIISVPVADLVGSPLDTTFPQLGKTIVERYYNMPYSGLTFNDGIACPRLHQGIYNELVKVIALYEHQACIAVPHLFYVTHDNKAPQNIYWTLKSNLTLLSDIKTPNATAYIPSVLDFTSDTITQQPNTMALLHPWQDPSSRFIFSAGTRFIYDSEKSNADNYAAYILNHKSKQLSTVLIPTSYCIACKATNKLQAQKMFLTILRQWALHNKGYIPYVWGGCSYCTLIDGNNFEQKTLPLEGTMGTSFYTRAPSNKKITMGFIKTGFDCAGLITRAAQMSGIPYFYKNTFTLALHLNELKKNEKLEEGDLIWIPGHVMVISSLEKGTLIEARSYMHGYGIIHEIALNKVFKDITTYNDLIKAFRQRSVLIRLDSAGTEVEHIKKLKLLKMASVWK